MLCTNCGRREADVFIEHTANGKTTKTALCDKCADTDIREKDRLSSKKLADDSIFTISLRSNHSQNSCPLCSMTLDEIISSSSIGCPSCYKTFAPELSSMISYIHGSAIHSGGAPKRYHERAAREKRLLILKAELDDAVKNQLFEKCVILRDEICALEGEAVQYDTL